MVTGVGEAGQALGQQAAAQEDAAGLRAAPEQGPGVQAVPEEGLLLAGADNAEMT